MTTVGAYEAKTNLAKLLDRVSKGERITIVRHGVPVAVLVPPDSRAEDAVEATLSIRELRRGKTLGRLGLKALVEEGRR
jgi:prevent-host-death family protein